jgi:hypothetical protein
MMGFIEAVLAVVGLVALIAAGLKQLPHWLGTSPLANPAAPYQQGLAAAARLQQVALEMEQQIHSEAARHVGAGDKESDQSNERKRETA